MDSSSGPVKAVPGAIAGGMSGTGNAARGRSTSPGQYTSGGLSARGVRSDSYGLYGGAITAWAEGTTAAQGIPGMASPRTPRQTHAHGSSELRLSVAVGELQRQADAERRSTSRQIQQLERRLQEQVSQPAAGRERWADLQGSVSGMLEELSGMARRVDGLEQKLRERVGSCEEGVRQRTRELEQQVHASEHKAHLAATTSEESMKRQSAKMRKVGQALEDHARRLDALDEVRTARRPELGPGEGALMARLDTRLLELEQRQLSFEAEVHSLGSRSVPWRRGLEVNHGDGGEEGANGDGPSEDNDDPVLRALERDLSALAQRTADQLDEHSAALANIRVRTEGQDQRLTATTDRLDSVLAPPLEALRSEMTQMRERDRQEIESRFEDMKRRLQSITDMSEEMGTELREQLSQVEESCSGRQALRQLEAFQPREPQQNSLVSPEEFCQLLMRTDHMEQRVEFLEKEGDEQGLEEKADRTELLRVEAAVRELSEPLRRLSQKAASQEAKSSALERRVEQLQQHPNLAVNLGEINGSASTSAEAVTMPEEVSAALMRVDVISEHVAELKARVIDVESLVEGGSHHLHVDSVIRGGGRDISLQVEDLRTQVEDLCSSVGDLSKSSTEHADVIEKTLQRVTQLGDDITVQQVAAAKGSRNAVQDGNSELIAQEIEAARKELHSALQDALSKQRGEQEEKRLAQNALLDERTSELTTKMSRMEEVKINVVQAQLSDLRAELEGRVKRSEETAALACETVAKLPVFEERIAGLQKEWSELQTEHAALGHGGTGHTEGNSLEDLHSNLTSVAEEGRKAHALIATLTSQAEGHDENVRTLAQKAEEALRRTSVTEDGIKRVEEKLDNFQNDQEDTSTSKDSLKCIEQKLESLERNQQEKLESLERSQMQLTNEASLKSIEEKVKSLEHSQFELSSLQSVSKNTVETIARLEEKLQALEHIRPQEVDIVGLQKRFEMSIEAGLEEQLQALAAVESKLLKSSDGKMEDIQKQLDKLQGGSADMSNSAGATQALQEEVRTSQADLKQLSKQVEKAMAMVEASEAATMAVREELMCSGATGTTAPSAEASPACNEIEDKLAELSKKVSMELLELQKHQEELSAVKAFSSMAPKLETDLEELSKQMAAELQELREHQSGLVQAKESTSDISKVVIEVDKLSSQVADELKQLRTHQDQLREVRVSLSAGGNKPVCAEALGSGATQEAFSQLETKVESLSEEVIRELRALTSHQDELRGAKANIRDLSDQMNGSVRQIEDCQKAVLELKKAPATATTAAERQEQSATKEVVHQPSKLEERPRETLPESSQAAASASVQPAAAEEVESVSSYDGEAFDEDDERSLSGS